MYRGFKLKLDDIDNVEFLKSRFKRFNYINKGKELFESFRNDIKYKLDSFILEDGTINGTAMQRNWFPQIEADIFISHSHKDEELALALAGWLYEKFEIISFIDSCVWGYSNELLKIIDKRYCLKEDGYYDYNMRNFSTSIVHMMLSTALTMMIDNTESIFLLNTNNSINTSSFIKESTNSPWLYSEITISKLIQKKEPKRHYRRTKLFSKKILDNLNENFKFDVDTEHLRLINETNLEDWVNETKLSDYGYPLDVLYSLFPQKKLNIIL